MHTSPGTPPTDLSPIYDECRLYEEDDSSLSLLSLPSPQPCSNTLLSSPRQPLLSPISPQWEPKIQKSMFILPDFTKLFCPSPASSSDSDPDLDDLVLFTPLGLAFQSNPDIHPPASPYLWSSELPPLELELEPGHEDDFDIESPCQKLLALPGADVDDSLLPAFEQEDTNVAGPSRSSFPKADDAHGGFSTLLIFDDDDNDDDNDNDSSPSPSPSPELDQKALFKLDFEQSPCPHGYRLGDSARSPPQQPCWCRVELDGLTRLRRHFSKTEREARNAEGKLRALAAVGPGVVPGVGLPEKTKSGHAVVYGCDGECGDRARCEARRRVKREKERGREVGELVRLQMLRTTGSGSHVEEEEVETTKKKKKHEFKSVDQLVAKMMLRRRDSCAYRPLAACDSMLLGNNNNNNNNKRFTSSPLVTGKVLLPFVELEADGESEDEDEDEMEEMVADAGDSPFVPEETLTPRAQGEDAALLVLHEHERDFWGLGLDSFDGDDLHHVREFGLWSKKRPISVNI